MSGPCLSDGYLRAAILRNRKAEGVDILPVDKNVPLAGLADFRNICAAVLDYVDDVSAGALGDIDCVVCAKLRDTGPGSVGGTCLRDLNDITFPSLMDNGRIRLARRFRV